jgi:hypothetical protein
MSSEKLFETYRGDKQPKMSKKGVLLDILRGRACQNVQEEGFIRLFEGRAAQNVQEEGIIRHFEETSLPKCPKEDFY